MSVETIAIVITVALLVGTLSWGAAMHVCVSHKHKRRQERERELTAMHRVRR